MIPRLHVVTNDEVLASSRFLETDRSVVEAGGSRIAFHLRGPRTPGRTLWHLGREMMSVTRSAGAAMVVNDRVDLALALGSEAVHLGRRSLPFAEAASILGEDVVIGCSVHGEGEILDCPSPHYFMVGPIFPTGSHPEHPGSGVVVIDRVRLAAPGIPIIAIGGVTPECMPDLVRAGAWGVSSIGAIWGSDDPAAAALRFLEALDAYPVTDGESREPMGVRVNGKERQVSVGTTVRTLLESLDLVPETIVVERNREILDRARYADTELESGDQLELVHFVGGG